jgi:hypothetical protein
MSPGHRVKKKRGRVIGLMRKSLSKCNNHWLAREGSRRAKEKKRKAIAIFDPLSFALSPRPSYFLRALSTRIDGQLLTS